MKKFITLTIIAALSATVAFGAPNENDKKQEQFTALLKKVQTSPAETSEKEIHSLLEMGRSLGRSYTTSLALRGYFTRNFQPSPTLLREAAEIAVLSADFRSAAARYKAYLSSAGKDGAVNGDSKEVASRSAAKLYYILVDFLDSEDDAYQFIAQNGTRFRSTEAARKFDLWFLRTARRREDWPAMANYLVDVLEDRMPIEKERLHYWSLLDELADELTKADKQHFNTLSAARKMSKLIRDSKVRSARWKLIAENLAFQAASAGKEEQLLDRQFGSVTAAARDYLKDAPSAGTLEDICRIFAGGAGRFDNNSWKRQQTLKEAFFVQAFSRLPDNDKLKIAQWYHADHLASAQQWTKLVMDNANIFKGKSLRRISLQAKLDDLGDYHKLADILSNTYSREAATIKAIAVGGKDWKKVVDHYMTRETWAFGHNDIRYGVEKELIPALQNLLDEDKDDDKTPLPEGEVWVYLGLKHLATSPAAYYDEDAAKEYFKYVWKYSGKDENDKSQIAKHIKALAWVPWSERDRKEVYNQISRDYSGWANWVRREYGGGKNKEKMPDSTRKLLNELDALLRDVKSIKGGDPDQAPNELCKQFTLLIQADNDRDRPAYVKAGQAAYKQIKDYRQVPTGRLALRTLLATRRNFSTIDLQTHVLKDMFDRYDRSEHAGTLEYLVDYVIDDQYRWRWNNIDSKHKDDAKRIAGVLDGALLKLAKKGEFWAELFGQFRMLRNGRGWDDRESGTELMTTLIEKQLLSKVGYDGFDSVRSPVVGEMWLVRREFPKLARKYSPESWFDSRYIAEAKELGFYDYAYWQYGTDKDGKIIRAAAEEFKGHKTMPLGFEDDRKRLYSRDEYYDWCRRLAEDKKIGPEFTDKLTDHYGKGRWDIYAMGWAYFQQAKDITTDAGRKEFFERLKAVTARLEAAPSRPYAPYMGQLEKIDNGTKLSKDEVDVLLGIFPNATPSYWSKGWHYATMGRLLHDAMIAQDRRTELYRVLPHLWKIGRDVNQDDYMRHLADQARTFISNEQHDLALVTSMCGLELAKGRMPEDARSTVVAVRSSAVAKIGAVIPVDRSDPRYPLFVSQASYLVGKEQTAWETYLKNEDRLLQSFKDLDPQFCFWLIEKNIEARRYQAAETLAEAMIQWFDSATSSFEPEIRAALQNAYANISFAKGEFPKARASYNAVAMAREFEGTQAQMQAMLRVAEVDRQTRQYDQALKVLEKLAHRKDKWLRTEAQYQLALVKFDQGEHADAKEALDKVFSLAPDHAEARILEGRINLKLKKLEDPTDLQIGSLTAKRYLVPGMPLKVTLEDRNLSVVGKSTNIEIVAWTKSGDREVFLLTPFGDSKTKFRGQIATALEPINKGDHVLQLLGGDVVRYDFSEKFKKANKITRQMTHALRVVTDGELHASSGEILTKEQREQKAVEDMIRKRINATEEQKEQVALSTVRSNSQVKPGNEINIRVVDPDRSVTAGKDEVRVRVTAASGDTVSDLVLTETDTHSGVFEGSVPTASGQPIAMASDTQEGKYANFAISKKDYGPWVAQPNNQRPKTFSVDLNDNVKLNKMAVTAGVPGRRIKKFLLQTSLNGKRFTTIGSWPSKIEQWDGSPKVRAVRVEDPRNVPTRLDELNEYIEWGHLAKDQPAAESNITLPKVSWGWNIADGLGKKINLHHKDDDRYYVAKISAAFYQPRRQIRTFRLDHKGKTEGIRYILVLDGEASESRRGRRGQSSSFPEVQKKIAKGVHRIDIYVIASDNTKPEFELMCDTEEAPFMAPCPAEMFDPGKNDLIADGVKVPAATITADKDNETFEMSFVKPSIDLPSGTQARVVRLVMLDFETDAPAINEITLTDAAGDTVLPTKDDFLELRKNKQLELVPGDRISVTYEDPSVLSRGKELHEAFLTATYSNAQISACFVEYEQSRGEARPRYVPMYRFKPGDVVKVFISDPDMDVSHQPDRVKFQARTSLGKPVELEAIETEAHSGVFLGTVFPIESGKKPARRSELTVEKGDDIILTYMDESNTDPGIPWQRTTSIEQTWFSTPQLRVYDVTSAPLDESTDQADGKQEPAASDRFEEQFPAERILQAVRPEEVDYSEPAKAIIGGPVLVEVIFPSAAQSPASTITLYAQTSTGRKAANVDPNIPFDIRVPGTIELKATPGSVSAGEPGRGYLSVQIGQGPQLLSPLEEGRFAFNIPVELGALPEKSLATQRAEDRPKGEKPSLLVNGDDAIFVGMKYTDPKTKTTQWITRKVTLDADIFFDVMDRRYQKEMDGLYVGQNIYYRVIDPKKDLTDGKDRIELEIKTQSGQSESLELIETFSHSGIFKGLNKMIYSREAADPNADLSGDVLEVVYGDIVNATYRRNETVKGITRSVEIFKGSDGEVIPFTKRFKDSTIAVKTQFHIAQAYFEQAKRHRQLGQPEIASDEIAKGKKLLEDAIRDYPDTTVRAQADYLLATLALEFGNEVADAIKRTRTAMEEADTPTEKNRYAQQIENYTDERKKHYAEAVTRFADIVSTYPNSEYAPKAQFKKALTFERMGQIDEASEEYVKLSYRYPENELVAKTIVRLGNYFMTKGKMLRDEAKKESDPVEMEKQLMQARKFFKTAGQVLGRLGKRFPAHEMAGKASVLSAQCYIHAKEHDLAVEASRSVIDNPRQYDSALVAEAMYWCGDSYMVLENYVDSYRMFKKLTWDYPATVWAKYARGRLTDEKLSRVASSDAG
ncbi:MAG: tetratricopeptide repeat protein [Phycisphaerae bacterium]